MCACIAMGGKAALVFLVLREHAVQLKDVAHWFLTQIWFRSRSDPSDEVVRDANAEHGGSGGSCSHQAYQTVPQAVGVSDTPFNEAH